MKQLSIESLVQKVKNNSSSSNVPMVRGAFEFARKVHKGQKRKTGEDFITHPLTVAHYVADLKLDEETVIAALLHDAIEEGQVKEEEIERLFGKGVRKLVTSVTKLRHTDLEDYTSATIENTRKLILASIDDVRVLLLKLADRPHNARTIQGLSEERQKTYAKELIDIFTPLADYVGLRLYKREFEDIGFKVLYPDEYKRIQIFKESKKFASDKFIKRLENELKTSLEKEGIKADVYGRVKGNFSIFLKLKKYLEEEKINDISELQQLGDIVAFRIITKTRDECYRALAVIHSKFEHVVEEFEDYIQARKPNGYRSIHTTLLLGGEKIEVQIRTRKMHEFNEFGPAAHFAYKSSGKRFVEPTEKLSWLKKLEQWREYPKSRINLFRDNIYVFTPKGAVKQLPKGATPIDFAFLVHTDIGKRCKGVKVNNRAVKLNSELKTGDVVEVLVNKKQKYAKKDWLEFARMRSTREKIERSLREQREKERKLFT